MVSREFDFARTMYAVLWWQNRNMIEMDGKPAWDLVAHEIHTFGFLLLKAIPMQYESKWNAKQNKNCAKNCVPTPLRQETNNMNSITYNYLPMNGATIEIIRLEAGYLCIA